MLKLVALDIDGTIVGPDFALPDEVIEAVGKLQAAGVAVTLATGRMLRSTRGFAARLGIGRADHLLSGRSYGGGGQWPLYSARGSFATGRERCACPVGWSWRVRGPGAGVCGR